MKFHRFFAFAWAFVLATLALQARAEEGSESEEERAVAVQIGPVGERNLKDKTSSAGATAAVEVTPMEDLLKIEAGATLLATPHRREMIASLLFKTPLWVSPDSEILMGAGPKASKALQDTRDTAFGFLANVEYAHWFNKSIGWYAGPEYGVGVGKSKGEHTVGLSAGILLGW